MNSLIVSIVTVKQKTITFNDSLILVDLVGCIVILNIKITAIIKLELAYNQIIIFDLRPQIGFLNSSF